MRRARGSAFGTILAVALVVAPGTGLTAPSAQAAAQSAQAAAPLELVATYELPDVPTGPYADHMAVDVAGQRLFTTPQAAHAVEVVDLGSGRVLRSLTGIADPHAILYRGDRDRLFVTDGAGSLLVFDARRYRRVRRIPLEPNADGIAYDERSGLLYVAAGGEEAGRADAQVSIIDTTRETRIADIPVHTPALEALVVDVERDRLYVNDPEENAILVIDLGQRRVRERWPLALARRNEAFALDAPHARLYVGCNEGDVRGALVVVDTASGHELERLPLGSWVDSMYYDERRDRLYASTGIGEVFSYQRGADGRLRALEPTATAVMARTSLFEPALDRLFVMVPHLGWTSAKVLVFQPR